MSDVSGGSKEREQAKGGKGVLIVKNVWFAREGWEENSSTKKKGRGKISSFFFSSLLPISQSSLFKISDKIIFSPKMKIYFSSNSFKIFKINFLKKYI